MSTTEAELQEQIRRLRARAAQSRRLGDVVGTERDRRSLHEYAANLDRQAEAMEAAGAAEPAPVAVHQNPVQMAQAQLTPGKDGERDEAPTNSD